VIVVDANVAAKWFLPEKGSAEAEQLLSDARKILAPELIRTEVAGAITRKVRSGELAAEKAIHRCGIWLKQLEQHVVTLIPDEEVFESAVRLSVEIKHPLQDCLYLAVARQYDTPLITADKKFHDRASAIDTRVLLLVGCKDN
jgi:predicted nucleic acid-binding protein